MFIQKKSKANHHVRVRKSEIKQRNAKRTPDQQKVTQKRGLASLNKKELALQAAGIDCGFVYPVCFTHLNKFVRFGISRN